MGKVLTMQERQNEIYRKMSVKKKVEITFDFFRIGKYLNGLKNDKGRKIVRLLNGYIVEEKDNC